MKLEFLRIEGEQRGGGLLNNILHLNRPEKNFKSFIDELTGKGKNMINNKESKNKKFIFIPASKTKYLDKKIK
jgi:hypothetical protein